MTADTQRWIEREEASRDLRVQLGSLASDEEREIEFTEWSPGRKIVTIWNTETGEEVSLPRYQARAAIYQPNAAHNGYLWTTDKEKAPERKINTVKCFLHPQSEERELVNNIGITTVCMSEHLASNNSKWEHARNKHSHAFRIYRDEQDRVEREKSSSLQAQQTEAMLKLAGMSAAVSAEVVESIADNFSCDKCGKVCASESGLYSHTLIHNKRK